MSHDHRQYKHPNDRPNTEKWKTIDFNWDQIVTERPQGMRAKNC